MKNILIISCFVWCMASGFDLRAQDPYDSAETAKLRSFLIQESAEPGIRNYEQLGIEDVNNIKWGEIAGLSWNHRTYLLETINWPNKKLSGNMDLSGFAALKYLSCSHNEIDFVDVTGATSLLRYDLYENNLESVDVTTNPNLTYIRLGYNHIQHVDLSNNPSLTFFCCTNNRVEHLDLSNKAKLQTIYCSENQLLSVNVQNCDRLKEFSCIGNKLTEIDVSNARYLADFSCSRNNISSVNVLNCASLVTFDCSYNEIESIDFSGCVNLLYVKCSDNKLKELCLNDCLLLEELFCYGNLLDSLKLPESPSLRIVNCKQNNLDFYSLPPVLPTFTEYIYYPQNNRTAEMVIDSADLSHYYEIDGFISNYTWNDGPYWIKPEMKENGIFSFEESYLEKQLVCRIENETFSKLVLRYDVVLKELNDVGNENPESFFRCYGDKGVVHIVTKAAADVRIFSLNGRVVFSKHLGEGHVTIPLDPGFYVVTLPNNVCYKLLVR
ncbi:MAG TPA: hypothetical protein DEQ30_14490 [Porphyromonadaceae bacterium]|nr:hypothetical protein [Porphyromonadaceae bacterium]